MVNPIIGKIKSAIHWDEYQKHWAEAQKLLKISHCLTKMAQGFPIDESLDFDNFHEMLREKLECIQLLDEWFKKLEEEAEKMAIQKDLQTLSTPALELIKKHLPEGKEPVAGDLYSFFGLEKGASSDEIKNAYRKMTLAIHPDKQPKENFKIAGEAFLFIKNVYEKLQSELS